MISSNVQNLLCLFLSSDHINRLDTFIFANLNQHSSQNRSSGSLQQILSLWDGELVQHPHACYWIDIKLRSMLIRDGVWHGEEVIFLGHNILLPRSITLLHRWEWNTHDTLPFGQRYAFSNVFNHTNTFQAGNHIRPLLIAIRAVESWVNSHQRENISRVYRPHSHLAQHFLGSKVRRLFNLLHFDPSGWVFHIRSLQNDCSIAHGYIMYIVSRVNNNTWRYNCLERFEKILFCQRKMRNLRVPGIRIINV
mmetsp:Transcript_10707/g.21242  ORF Transcript_10707/g.21242 Transcript_10707/m.21242 type:complete len:251 (-) Transcript_10707:16-768(-)